MTKSRTLGWIQNAADTASLKIVARIFVVDSPVNKNLRETKIPRLIADKKSRRDFIALLTGADKNPLPYAALKGKGGGVGGRKNAPCSGIVQAAISAQGDKEYLDDWSADSFLRWAIALGILDYDRENDACSLSGFGRKFAATDDASPEEKAALEYAYLSYPPAVRVLLLLERGGHLTKFEIGEQLGIIGESGFTSVPQNLFLQGVADAITVEEKRKIRQNVEGDADKYARMIAGWLAAIGWVKREPKTVTGKLGNTTYVGTITSAFILTLEGKTKLKQAFGSSRAKKIPKIVYWEMLATKPADKIYLRTRRAHIIQAINKSAKTSAQIAAYLAERNFYETENSIVDDIRSLVNIGLTVQEKNGAYRLTDEITHLTIPIAVTRAEKSNLTAIKDQLRGELRGIDHKYLNLIDLSFAPKNSRDFEIQTLALLTNELDFGGLRLGESRKPDGIIYRDERGVVIDTKAYAQGYHLPINQQDEMLRYLDENQKRDAALNPNRWWRHFPDRVSAFSFLFVSSKFATGIAAKIHRLARRAQNPGAVITAQNLLRLADKLKLQTLSYADGFDLLASNEEIIFS